MRRRAIVFTIAFFLLFSSLLSLAILYSVHLQNSGRSFTDARTAWKEGLIADNAASNIMDLLSLTIDGSRTTANTTVQMTDHLPAYPGSLSGYASFFNSTFAPATNINSSLNVTNFTANPFIYANASGMNYSYDSLGKNNLNFSYPTTLNDSSMQIRFNGTIDKDESGWSWAACSSSCSAGQFHLTLDIQNSTGSSLTIGGCSSGCLSKASQNLIRLNGTSPDVFNLTVSGSYLSIKVSSTAALDLQANMTFNQTNETIFVIPVQLKAGGSSFPYLAVARI